MTSKVFASKGIDYATALINNQPKSSQATVDGGFQQTLGNLTSPKNTNLSDNRNTNNCNNMNQKLDDSYGNKNVHSNRLDENKKKLSPQNADNEVIMQALNDAMQAVKESIASELQVSVEEVDAIMAELGLELVDLLDPKNVINLMMTLTGETDQLAFVTNESLFQNLQNVIHTLNDVTTNLQDQFSLSEDELASLVKQFKQADELQSDSDVDVDKSQIVIGDKSSSTQTMTEDSVDEVPAKSQDNLKDISNSDKELLQNQSTKDMEQQNSNSQDDMQEESNNEVSKAVTTTNKDVKSSEPSVGQFDFTQQIQQKLEAILPKENTVFTTDVSKIMEQIKDSMRIQVSSEVTEMSMQLNPANLGSVHLQVAYKEGVLTAQFAAQNESVKAALETQVVQLKETLEGQGLKVEAIEVTIASHEFERNLQQQNQNQQNLQHADKGTNKRKKIELSDLELEDELDVSGLDAEDQLTAKMMAANGSTVYYTA